MTEKPTATLLAAEHLLSAQTGHWPWKKSGVARQFGIAFDVLS
jgi:hypothetical protein